MSASEGCQTLKTYLPEAGWWPQPEGVSAQSWAWLVRHIPQGSGEYWLGRQGLTFLSAQVAELEAQAATAEPPAVSEKEGPGQSLEQLEALVQTKDQVCECVCMRLCFLGPCLP